MPEVEPLRHRDRSRLAGGAAQSIGGRLTGRLLNFSSHILLARVLGPASLGLYALGWVIAQAAVMFVSLGLHNGVVYFGSKIGRENPGQLRPLFRSSLVLALGAATAAAVALWLFAPRLALSLAAGDPELTLVLRCFALGVPLMTGLKVAAAATRVSQRMSYSVLAEDLGQPVTHLLVLCAVLAGGAGLLGAVSATVASFGVGLALALGALSAMLRADASAQVSTYRPAALLRYSLPTALAGVLSASLLWLDRLLLGHFLGASEVGIYQAAAQTALFFQLILAGFNTMFAPMIAEYSAARRLERLEELYRVTTKWSLYLTLPILVTTALVPQAVMLTLFGAPYLEGASALRILTLGQFLNVATGSVGFLLIMTGRQTRWLVYSAWVLAANLVLNLLLIPRFGPTGAAAATAVSVGALFVLGLSGVRSTLGIWPYDARSWKIAAGTALSALAVLGVRELPIRSAPATLLAAAAASALAFFSVIALTARDAEDRAVMARLKRPRSGADATP